MPTIRRVWLENGEIRFVAKINPVPATSETTGIVTINNAAQPGIEAHYKTNFMLDIDVDIEGVAVKNVFYWKGAVLSDDQDAPYRSIEDLAARQIAPMLRAVADELDKHIAGFDAQ